VRPLAAAAARALGLDSVLVATTVDDLAAKAVHIASDVHLRARISASLRCRMPALQWTVGDAFLENAEQRRAQNASLEESAPLHDTEAPACSEEDLVFLHSATNDARETLDDWATFLHRVGVPNAAVRIHASRPHRRTRRKHVDT
jgi:hypothetical protein